MTKPAATALVTGVDGFCGRHLARRLTEEGVYVVGIDVAKSPATERSVAEYIVSDLRDAGQTLETVVSAAPELVFHLAGVVGDSAPEIFRTNLLGTIHLLEAVRVSGRTARVLIVGSAAEYGHVAEHDLPVTEELTCHPVGPYALSKHGATLVALDYANRLGMKVVVARPFNIVGPGVSTDLVVGALLSRMKLALAAPSEPVIRVGNIDSKRDFIAVEDVVEAYLAMIRGESWGEIFNICSGVPCSIREIINVLVSQSPRTIRFEVDPALVRESEIPVMYGSWGKASRAFGFRPTTPLAAALASAWQYEIGHSI